MNLLTDVCLLLMLLEVLVHLLGTALEDEQR